MTEQKQLPYVIFQVKQNLYAVNSGDVREILILPAVTVVPNAPPEVRGVINLRGKVLKLLDLRVKLGLPSAKAELDELVKLLSDREEDHRRWLAELEACVRERRPFKLARDHHKCKFGVWCDSFRTDDSLLRMTLNKLDAPHQAIHAAATKVLDLAEGGDEKGALEVLEARRHGELALLVKHLQEARRLLLENHRELAVVLARARDQFAMTIDFVESVEAVPEERVETLPEFQHDGKGRPPWRIGKRLKTNQTILLLNDELLFTSAGTN